MPPDWEMGRWTLFLRAAGVFVGQMAGRRGLLGRDGAGQIGSAGLNFQSVFIVKKMLLVGKCSATALHFLASFLESRPRDSVAGSGAILHVVAWSNCALGGNMEYD